MDTLPAAEVVASPTPSFPTPSVPTASDSAVSDSVPAAPAGLRESDIVGLKYFDQLLPLLKRLRDEGCTREILRTAESETFERRHVSPERGSFQLSPRTGCAFRKSVGQAAVRSFQ